MGGVFGIKNENQRTIGHITLNDGDQLSLKNPGLRNVLPAVGLEKAGSHA